MKNEDSDYVLVFKDSESEYYVKKAIKKQFEQDILDFKKKTQQESFAEKSVLQEEEEKFLAACLRMSKPKKNPAESADIYT